MSRSRRKQPVAGITSAPSEKDDKVQAHKRIRRHAAQTLATIQDDSTVRDARELSNPWVMAKDGKLRFDPEKSPKGMRK